MSKRTNIVLVVLFTVVVLLTGCGDSPKEDMPNSNVETSETESIESESSELENTESSTAVIDTENVTEDTEVVSDSEEDSSEVIDDSLEDETQTEEKEPVQDNSSTEVPSDNESIEEEIQIPSEPEKKTWFDEKGFKITPWSEDFCVVKEEGHVCNYQNIVEFVETKEECDEGYKYMYLSICNWSDGCLAGYYVNAFDKYTGLELIGWRDEYWSLEYNGHQVEYKATGWAGGGITGWEVMCSEDYDGVVFVLHPRVRRIEYSGDRPSMIDEVIDFSGNDCYFFSITNE